MIVTLTIDSQLSFCFSALKRANPECWEELRKKCTHPNPDFFKQQRLGFSTQGIPASIKTFSVKGTKAHFQRGLIRTVRKTLQKHGHQVRLVDNRLVLPAIEFRSNTKLRKEQVAPVDAVGIKQQGLIRGPCSAGKTVVLLEAIARAKQPALVVVWSSIHQRQWISEATNNKLFNLSGKDIGGVGGIFKQPKFGKLNICMQQSLWRKKNLDFFRDRVGFVGCDEVQKFAANTFQFIVNAFPAKFRVGVSANERRRDGKEFLIYSTFGKVIHSISESANIGSRMKAQIFLVPTDFYSEAYDMRQNWTGLIGELSDDPERNKLLVSLVKRSISKKKLCLILTERVSHALSLREQFSGFRVGLLIGQQQAKKIREADWPDAWKVFVSSYDADSEFTRVTKLAAKRKLDVIIATAKGDVGLNVKTIDHGFITTPTGSNTERFNQQKGRAERNHDGKKVPRIYYLWDVKQERLREAGNVILKVFPGCGVFRFKSQTKDD